MAMAGRFMTKGVAWKNTVVTLVAEKNQGYSIPTFKKEEKLFSGTPRLSNLWNKTTFSGGLQNNFQNVGSFHGSACKAPFLSGLGNYVGGNLMKYIGRENVDTIGNGAFTQILRCYSNSSSSGADDQKPDKPGVGIISSMFKEEGKEAEDAKTEKEVPKKEEESGQEEDGDNKKKTEDPFMRSQRYAKWMLLGTFAFGVPALVYTFGPPVHDEFGNIIQDEFMDDPIPIQYIKRSYNQLNIMKKDIVEPSSQKLLPDPLQAPYYQPPYTLVIELFDVLLHPVYDQVHGWRFKKRPGIDYFLENVGPPLYEIVIFTRENGLVAYPLIDSMDPKGYIMYRLFRDAARFKSGFHVGNIMKGELPKLDPYYQKDLTYLNRDLNRVIVVDNDKRATELQPNNGISLKPWDGSSTDTELFDLAAFLRTIATNEVDDVRPVLEHYGKYEDPLAAFKLAQVRMHEEQVRLERERQQNSRGSSTLPKAGGSGFSVLTNFFRSRG